MPPLLRPPAPRSATASSAAPGSTRAATVSPAELIVETLSIHLGPSTARTAVRTFSKRTLGLRPEEISLQDVPRLLEALRPMLRTLLGRAPADEVLEGIRGHLG